MRNKRLILSAILLLGLGLTGMQAQQNNVKKTDGAPVSDIDGNIYHTVTIGTQTWMCENLKTTRYRNGDSIGTTNPAIVDISKEIAPKYQWAYKGKESNVATYGRIYTWHTLTDNRKVCPTGWHVSSDAEWITLVNYLGGDKIAGAKLKEEYTWHWKSPNPGAGNKSGFVILPSGNILGDLFIGIGEGDHYWTSTEFVEDNNSAWRWLITGNGFVQRAQCPMGSRWVVRCIKD